jgi:hypothetical protein
MRLDFVEGLSQSVVIQTYIVNAQALPEGSTGLKEGMGADIDTRL